jgi:CheY-like chemotaxis protein
VDSRILVVEDDLTVAEVVVDYLRHAGLEPRHALDGQTALEIAADWPPDLVVLDLMLPGIDGIEAIRRIRRLRPPLGGIAIIGVSGRGDDEEASRAAGADAFLVKPVSPRALATALLEATRRAAAAT